MSRKVFCSISYSNKYSAVMHLTVIVAVLLHSCSAGEQVRMTLLGLNPFQSEIDSHYQCHLSQPDFSRTDDGSVEPFRAGRTRPSALENPPPSSPDFRGRDSYPHYKIFLDNNGNNDGFGVFGCTVTRAGKLETSISTVRMRSDADIRPANGLFTQTVNIGDEGVSIRMERSTKNVEDLIWRHNNSGKLQIGQDTFTIDEPIRLDHAGIYECHADGERDLAKHGLNLLLVRACPANRWGPPDCSGVCDSCYNGGICDENNGKCVCPPGFMGDNCLTACGGNRYGYSCRKRCSSGGGEERCGNGQFCLVHPFGCRCNTGWKGLACTTECAANTFGASCLQSCHCTSDQCNRYTGRCTGSDTSCDIGWTGDNCQECEGNHFGANCSQECHCSKEFCNVESGLCKSGGCLPQWVDMNPPYSCQTGLQNITSTKKVNAEASAIVTCTAVEGPGLDLSSLDLFLSTDIDRLENNGITSERSLDDDRTKMQTFMVGSVEREDTYYCQLRDSSGNKLAVLGPLTIDVFELPVLTSSPTNKSVSVTSITISWSAWDDTRDVGDPPLVGYLAYYKKTGEDKWLSGDMLSSQTLVYTFTGLDPDTSYSFSVAAVREGGGGEGPRSPALNVTTMCKVPPSPQNVMTITEENVVKISWQIPSDDITCSSGITKFTIYYYFSSEKDLTSVDVTDPTATSFILSSLTSTDSYTFYMTLTTAGGQSEQSVKIGHDASSLAIAVSSVSAVFILVLIALVVVYFLKRRHMNSNPHTTATYDKSGSSNEAYTTDVRTTEIFQKEGVETEEEEGEEEEEEGNEVVYTNVEKPVSILIANLERYIRDCENSKTANLEQQFLLLNGGKKFDNHVGSKEENKTKNRFKNMIAYDHSRVILKVIDGDPHSDYYNANYIKNVEGEVAYIASQGPNKASVNDFWRMVLMANVHHIVMLTNLVEGGKDRCTQYWPQAVGRTKRFGNIDVTLEREEQFGDYDSRELTAELGEQCHKVTNWHFKTWPDKDIPEQASPLIEFANRVKSFQQTSPGPLLVHCSAGVGRTGTFIALCSLTDAMKYSTRIDIYGYVELMRQNRIRMVQTAPQYKFLHECLLEVFLMENTKIPVDSMQSIDFDAEKDKLQKQFKLLAKLSQRSTIPHTATTEESNKSRYPEILPVDKKRPFLQSPGKTSSSSYINACVVSSYRKKNAFIATQSPLPNTVEDFWRLVYDWSCPLIVMLNQLDPRDKTCRKYWPDSGSSQFGHMTVKLKDEQNMGFYVYRQFDVAHSFDQQAKSVLQMQLTSWDTTNLKDIMSLINDVEKLQQDYSMVTPSVIHCINGVGRTGVFLAIKSEKERLSVEEGFDVFTTVRKLRRSNPSMVYTEEDYYLCHQLLKLEIPESQYANI